MCSKCFKEAANKKENIKEQEELRIEESSNVRKHLRTPSPEPRDISSVTTPTPSTPSVTSTDSPKSDNKLGQTNKGKCFSCRKKVKDLLTSLMSYTSLGSTS